MSSSTTLGVEADAAVRRDVTLGAGAGNHLPVGYWSGALYRSAMRFGVPAGWQGWTGIVSATLAFYITDFQHVGPANSSIYIRRNGGTGGGTLWTKGEGSQSCESGFTAGNNTQASDLPVTSSGQVSFASGTTANAKKTVTVTSLVQAMWAANVSKMVFVFDPVGSSDVTEIWADEKAGYDAVLTIVYDVQSVPNAPTLVSPANAASVTSTLPTFQWTHNDPQGDPQASANVNIYDATGLTLLYSLPVAGAGNTVAATVPLTRGTTYAWSAQTADATGMGGLSLQRTFTVAPLPVVTIATARSMTYDPVAQQPRLVVNWTADQAQSSYRVQTASGYDSGTIAGSVQTHVIARNLTNGTAETVTVTVTAANGLAGQASQAFTPRWGLTTHRRDLTAAPLAWGTPSIVSPVVAGASLVIEYGSDPAANAVPASGWLSSLSSCPLSRYVFWRAWFLPSATASPILDSITIPSNSTVTLVDNWGTTRNTPGLTGVWKIDPGESVYGTRSMRADVTGAGPFVLYSYGIKIRANRNYILTGLMKSLGNSGAQFQLQKADGTVLTGGGMALPSGPVQSPALVATTDWYDATKRDTNRYRTPVYVSDSDQTVYVVLLAGGTNGAKAWFDAIKLEESTVATPWSPGALGAVVMDAGGLQIDAAAGGILRYRGSSAGARDVVEGSAHGLTLGTDTEIASPSTGALTVNAVPVRTGAFTAPISNVYTASTTWTKPAGLAYIVVECVGGGGGSGGVAATAATTGGAGGGGGGGGYARKVFPATALPATACTVTVGGAGAAGASAPGAGGVGGDSIFLGTGIGTVTGGGGTGGGASSALAGDGTAGGGAGGTASGGDINVTGSHGGKGGARGGSPMVTGFGGASGSGFGGAVQPGTPSAGGNAGLQYGGGAGGPANAASQAARAGAAGAAGVVMVTEFYL